MSSAAERGRLTPHQFLAIERRSEIRREYHGGSMYAMSGASRNHNAIAHAVSRAIGNQLDGRPCDVFQSVIRVRIEESGLYAYPDIVVACGQAEYLDDALDTLLNPIVLIEVLSPSTEAYDRGWKFEQHRKLASLREYVLIAQDRPSIDHYRRIEGAWHFEGFTDLDDTLRLGSIGAAIPLADIYRRVEWPPSPPSIADGT